MYKSIVVGTDGSASSRTAVSHAGALAALTGARLHLVHAFMLPSAALAAMPDAGAAGIALNDPEAVAAAKEVVEGLAAELRGEGVEEVQVHTVAGAAVDALCGVATQETADVIVVGNRGMKGVRRVLGSVPNSVAHHANCAVLIVPTT